MKRLKNAVAKIVNSFSDITGIAGCPNLFFSSLPEENKRDYYKAVDALKTFYDNLPQK